MKSGFVLAGIILISFDLNARISFLPESETRGRQAGNVLNVDDDNQTATHDGTTQYPYSSLQECVNNALSGDTIKVAGGSYGYITTMGKSLTILGGYLGGNSADYASGTGGDFSQQGLDPSSTVISGDSANSGVTITRFEEGQFSFQLDNFTGPLQNV